MPDPAFALQTAYKTALADLQFEGQAVAVYDSQAPDNAVPPYVILSRSKTSNEGTKTTRGRGAEINFDVVTRFGPANRSSLPAETIASIIEDRFCPVPGAITLIVPGFSLSIQTYIGTTPIETPTATGGLVRRIVTIDHRLDPAA